jgi:hypothetical protein
MEEDPAAAGGDVPPPPADPAMGADAGADPLAGGDMGGDMGGGLGGDAPPPPADPAMGADPMAGGDMGADPMAGGDTTEEIDITDLVNMTKSIKKGLEDNKTDNTSVVAKMDDVFSKLGELEQKLGSMDSIIARIDSLGSKVEAMKEPTPVERLEMRSLDSYPFNEKPSEFFNHKQAEMKASGKNEYVLTKDEINDYSADMVKNSFNPATAEEDEENNQDEFRF